MFFSSIAISAMSTQVQIFEKSEPLRDVVARNVRMYAGILNLSRTDVARFLNVSSATVSRKWNGKIEWSYDDLDRLAELFEVTPADLVTPRAYEKTPQRNTLRGLPSRYTAWDSNPEPAD